MRRALQAQVVIEQPDRFRRQRQHAHLVPLAAHADPGFRKDEIFLIQREHFTGT